MKKLFKGGTITLVMLLALCTLTVNADDGVYYTNLNGVEMTENEYNHIVNLLSDKKVTSITQDEFDEYMTYEIIDRDVIYQKVVSNEFGIVYEEEVTEEEYNASDLEGMESGIGGDDINLTGYFETNYKRLNVTLANASSYYVLLGDLTWKKIPACRSYDVFAFKTTRFYYSSVTGTQTYYVGSGYTNISYNTSSAGYKALYNGAGLSMNLKDGSNITSYDMSISAHLIISDYDYSTSYVTVSYQHAQSDVTRAQSMDYYLSSGGLGGVVYFNSGTIWNKYDGMTGIDLTLNH